MNKKHLTEAEQQELLLRIKKNYTYDVKSGRLTSSRYGRAIRGAKRDKKGYLCIHCNIDKRRIYVSVHHAVWAVCKGRWPEQQIDHINGNKHDNRIENLREVSQSENNSYRIKVGQHHYHFCDRYLAFYHLTLLGRRYKSASEGASNLRHFVTSCSIK